MQQRFLFHLFIFGLVGIFFFSGCSKKSTHPFAKNITASDLNAHLNVLTSAEMDGRFTASQGEAKAARYISANFDLFGLESPFWNGSYVQDFGVSMAHNLPGAVTITRDQYSYSSDTHGIRVHPLSSKNEVVGRSFAALSADDFSSIDFSEFPIATLLVSEVSQVSDVRKEVRQLTNMGADAVLLSSKNDSVFKPNLFALSDENFSIPVVFISHSVITELFSDTLDSLPKSTNSNISITIERTANSRSSKNVIGVIDIPETDSTIVIGAHFDHLGDGVVASKSESRRNTIHPGADDNASGVSVLLELADYLSENRDSLSYDIVFVAFSGEEIGLLGSEYYVKNPVRPLEETVFMINLDMVGQMRDNRLFISGIDTSATPKLSRMLTNANTQGLQLSFQRTDPQPGRSDQLSFINAGVPSTHLFTGKHEDYHTPGDTHDKLNLLGMRMVAQYVVEVLGMR